jgi:hypothetical protein
MTTVLSKEELGARRLLVMIFYNGPWGRLADRLWKVNEPEAEINENGLRARVATWAERRDHKWRERYVQLGTKPPERWKRK